VLERLFELTPAEARLAWLVGAGCGLTEAAERLGVSPHTARTQLKCVFAKTATGRQSQLVRLLKRIAAS
jgi:DNA-binding CsgD family transcriptional regulator